MASIVGVYTVQQPREYNKKHAEILVLAQEYAQKAPHYTLLKDRLQAHEHIFAGLRQQEDARTTKAIMQNHANKACEQLFSEEAFSKLHSLVKPDHIWAWIHDETEHISNRSKEFDITCVFNS